MRWPDFIVKAAASIACLIIWRYTLRFLAARIPTISGEEAYFPSHLVDDDKALNSYRLSIAEQSYQRAIKEPDHFSPLEIRIIASDRRQNYITQVIGFLLESYQSHRRLSPVLEICNVEQVVFEELQRFQLHVPIRTIGKASSRRATVKETIKKEAADYWNCLNRTTKARYVILLEDDALVVPDFARLMTLLMKQLDVNPHIDYVKMYHPNQLRKIPSIPMAVVMTVVTCCVYQLVIFRRVLAVWLLVTAIPMYATLRSYGSQLIADVRFFVTRSVYLSSPESCCTPAVIFRAAKIPEIVSRLSTEAVAPGHAKDHILDDSAFVGRQTDTNLVVHIGAVSSVRKRRIVLSEVMAARNRIH